MATESDVNTITLAGKMRSLPNLLKTTLRSEDKRYPFDPISLINVGKNIDIQIREKQGSINPISQMKAVGGEPTLSTKQFTLTRKIRCWGR